MWCIFRLFCAAPCYLRQWLHCKDYRARKYFLRWERGNMRRQIGPYLFVKRWVKRWLDRETGGRGLPWEAWGDVWGHRGSLWFVSLSITHTLISFVVCELNAPWQPVAVLPLCVTVWELCCAGGSPRSAPRRPRGRQLVYYGPHRGTDTGRRALVWISVWVNIWLLSRLGAISKDSSSVESEMTLSLLSISPRGFFIVAKLFSSLYLATCGVALLAFHLRLLLSCCVPVLIIKTVQQHVAVLKYLHTVCRRLQPWFEMLWTRGLSSTQSSSTIDDSPNRRKRWPLLQPFVWKVAHHLVNVITLH